MSPTKTSASAARALVVLFLPMLLVSACQGARSIKDTANVSAIFSRLTMVQSQPPNRHKEQLLVLQ